ncbi:hypothetical protein Tco_0643380 [Tanacetum coccineum]
MNLLEDQLHTILEDMHNYLVTCLEELEFFMTKWGVKPRVRVDTLEDPVDEMIARFRQVFRHADFHARDAQEKAQEKRLEAFENSCTYKEFRAVMQGNFRGTEGVVGLTRWFEKLESQFGISNVADGDRVKFASSTLLDGALTWWNVYTSSFTRFLDSELSI